MNDKFNWKAKRERKAFLALADGTVFHGYAFGDAKDTVGEAVFNTGMAGYKQILTDPSYAGQFVVFTTAEVGAYSAKSEKSESRQVFLNGIVINDLCDASENVGEESLDTYMKAQKKPGIAGVDTRALTLHLRDNGAQKAYLHVEDSEMSEAEAIKSEQKEKGYAVELRQYDSAPLAIEDLLNKRIDAALMDELPADNAIASGRAVKKAGTHGEVDNFGVALRKEDKSLKALIDEGYRKLLADPYWEELKNKYLNK